jgi:ribose/xylose/arabinose/galactoside ABC-type transport system permease subunit
VNGIRANRARWLSAPQFAPLAFLLSVSLLLAFNTPGFATSGNLMSILSQVAVVGIVAQAVNQVILAREIDVSTGGLLALCCFVYGKSAESVGGTAVPVITTLATGAAFGGINGLLVTLGRVPSIMTTLGTQLVARGAVLLWAANGVLSVPTQARRFGLAAVAGIPAPILLLAGTFALFAVISRHTTWGRDVLAVGGNPRAARAIGLPINSIIFKCFLASGAACGLAAAVLAGQLGQMQATVASGFELQVIAAVVLGGTRITGGRGSAVAPVVGASLVGVVLNGLTLNNVPVTLEELALGALILAAILMEALRSKLLPTA